MQLGLGAYLAQVATDISDPRGELARPLLAEFLASVDRSPIEMLDEAVDRRALDFPAAEERERLEDAALFVRACVG